VADILRPSAGQALAAWAERVRGNREQAERLREGPERTDFYAPVAGAFKADPHRTDEPALNFLRDLVVPGDTWLDVGAGGGRYALPLALLARNVIAVDTSESMLAVLQESMDETGIHNIRIARGRWPLAERPTADAALIAHVGYDIEEIGPFLDAMEAATRDRCVALLTDCSPASVADSFWPAMHGEARVALPALPELLAILHARGRRTEVIRVARPARTFGSVPALAAFLRRQLFIVEGGEKDVHFRATLPDRIVLRDGGWTLADRPAGAIGIVTWGPRSA
jgi:SAM-dependent methyltransferase